jgi:histidinol-phosphatase
MTLMEAVETVARLAGARALSQFNSHIGVEVKSDGTPVTEADRAAEKLAREWIASNFPDDGIVGEEFGITRPEAKRRWILDPIDGTKAFIRGVPLWGTMVAIAEGDTVLAGAVFYPALNELVVAERGAGCFWNGKRARVSNVSNWNEATALTTEAKRQPEGLKRILARAGVSRTWGDCYGYLLVATGRAEVMVDPVLSPWDIGALIPIIEEAGGVATGLDGGSPFASGSLVATNAALAKECRMLLAKSSPVKTNEVRGPKLDFTKGNGLITVVTQHAESGDILMVAHADAEAMEKTLATGEMHYRSRTRGLWHKGSTSGNVQKVVSLDADCDGDAVLARVLPAGPACHTGDETCFHDAPAAEQLGALARTIADRAANPKPGSYTTKLLNDRNLRLKKLGEESAELVMACADQDADRAVDEAADIFYHVLVALHPLGLDVGRVRRRLFARAAPSNLPR